MGEARKRVDDGGQAADRLHVRLGRRVQGLSGVAGADEGDLPLTVLLILMILFALYGNLKFPMIIFLSVLVTEPVGGLLGALADADEFQRFVDAGFRSVDGRGGADQRHSVFVHQ